MLIMDSLIYGDLVGKVKCFITLSKDQSPFFSAMLKIRSHKFRHVLVAKHWHSCTIVCTISIQFCLTVVDHVIIFACDAWQKTTQESQSAGIGSSFMIGHDVSEAIS